MPQVASTPEVKPLRADARRNREKVLKAARAVFADEGRDAQMDDVARRAGVGVGTVYRHFPTKEALIEALITESFQQIADEAERSLEIEDPWEAFTALLWTRRRGHGRRPRAERGVRGDARRRRARCPRVEGLNESVGKVIARAQASGVLRADVVIDDIPMLMCGIGSATKKEHPCPDAWRRHLTIVLDGLRAGSASGSLPQ